MTDEIGPFYKLMEEIYQNLRGSFKEFSKFQDLILREKNTYSSNDLVTGQKPESLVRQSVIDPILQFLGLKWTNETNLPTSYGRRVPDYSVYINDNSKPILYIEAEPLNTNLYEKEFSEHKVGLGQIKEWLYSRFAKSENAIATNGFFWVLVTLESEDSSIREMASIDLRPVFKRLLAGEPIGETKEISIILDNFLNLSSDRIYNYLSEQKTIVENDKNQVSNSFYVKYMEYVLGRNSKGDPIERISLLSSIIIPDNLKEAKKELFAVITMNRLIFIYFLEDRGLVPKNILTGLYQKYREAKPPDNFYNTYLKPLFYNVFNTSKESRPDYIKANEMYSEIPYLNGGLFNYVVEEENNYTIRDEGIDLVLNSLLSRVSIGLSNDANVKPEILGFIFERTINYISGKGTNAQKMLGAYYTPEDVVQYIVRNTLDRKIFSAMKDALMASGWKERDLVGLQNVEDILESVKPNEKVIAAMLNRVDQLKIIDPACGSGHFLTVVLNEIARVESSLLMIMGKSPDYYGIKRKVVTNNIYGVDLDEIGVEISKLRLWLSIISEIDTSEKDHIEALPNVEYNIVNGNTLVGHLYENVSNGLFPVQFDPLFYSDLNQIENRLGKDGKEIKAKLQSGRPAACIEAFSMFAFKYKSMSGKRALSIKHIMKRVRDNVYDVLGQAYLAYLGSQSSNIINKNADLPKMLCRSNPLHWDIDFSEIMKQKGFDVIVGNPPYVEDNAIDRTKIDLAVIKSQTMLPSGKNNVPLIYKTQDCGNTHAYFIERSLNLLKNDGILGFIVPISLVSTDRMAPVRELLMNSSSSVEYYNFDDRPGKIFSGIEHCRSTIVIASKGNGTDYVTTSKYHRWLSKDRPSLFDNLFVVDINLKQRFEIVPKIGTEIEKSILSKLYSKSGNVTICEYIEKNSTKVWYHNAPQYWIHAHYDQYVPKAEYYNDFTRDPNDGKILLGKPYETKTTSDYKYLEFKEENASAVSAILNSSMFYWWFVIKSDGRHLLSEHIASLPINLDKIDKKIMKSLKEKGLDLMKDYDLKSNVKVNIRKGGYAIKIREIIPKRSYTKIEEIDRLVAQIYDLTYEEADFIRNYDLNFRLGESSLQTSEDSE